MPTSTELSNLTRLAQQILDLNPAPGMAYIAVTTNQDTFTMARRRAPGARWCVNLAHDVNGQTRYTPTVVTPSAFVRGLAQRRNLAIMEIKYLNPAVIGSVYRRNPVNNARWAGKQWVAKTLHSPRGSRFRAYMNTFNESFNKPNSASRKRRR